jgi:hypothetical protein
MGVEDLITAEQKQKEAQHVDPVRHADGGGMAEKPAPPLDDRDIRCGSPQHWQVVLVGQGGLLSLSNGATIRPAGRPAIHSPSTLVDGRFAGAAGRPKKKRSYSPLTLDTI